MQAVRRRLISAAVVLAAGTVSALPFYRVSPTPDSTANSSPTDPQSASTPSAVALQIPGGESSVATVTGEEARRMPAADAVLSAESVAAGSSQKHPLPAPQLPHRRPAAQENVPPAAPIRRVDNDPVSSGSREPPSHSKNPQPRTHWIADGDTLEGLARSFLGDRSRWREIRDANRDILTTDDILPIGKEIRIPPREGGSSQAANLSAGEKNGLVPIPWHNK